MISLTSTPHGVQPGRRQGRSRAFATYQSSSRSASIGTPTIVTRRKAARRAGGCGDNAGVIGTVLDAPRRVAATLLTLLVLGTVGTLAVFLDATPPSPRPADAPPAEFSAGRAVGELDRFADRPRHVGSPASDAARRHLTQRLREQGLRVRIQRGVGVAETEGRAALGRVQNIVATLPGSDPTGSVILTAHYDSVAAGPGASDDGAAVAAMLETVRAVRAGETLRNDLVLLITDGEEEGLLGASSFVADDPLARRPGVVLNWEARGTSGPSLMFETSDRNAALVNLFAHTAPHPNGDSSLVELYRLLPNDTDFSRLRERLPGLNSAYIGGSAFYHTPQDTVANLDRGSLQQHGANMLGLATALGATNLSTLDSDHDATYFRFLGRMQTYSDTVALLIGVLAGLAVAVLAVLVRARRLASLPKMLLGFVTVPIPLLLGAALTTGMAVLVEMMRPELAAAIYVDLLFVLASVAVTVFAIALWYALLCRRVGPAALAVAGLAALAVFGGACLVLVPGMAFLFSIPALAAAVGGALAVALRRVRPVALVVLLLGALPAVVFYVPFSALTFTGLGMFGGGPAGTAVGSVLCGLALLSLFDLLFGELDARRRTTGWPVVASAVAAVVLLGGGLLLQQYDEAHPRRSFLSYVLHRDTGEARWVTTDSSGVSWGRGYARDPDPAGYPAVLRDEAPLWTSEAPAVALPGPRVRQTGQDGASRTLRISSARGARQLTVLLDRPEALTVRVAGNAAVRVTPRDPAPDGARYRLTFVDLPRDGVELTVRSPAAGPFQFAVFDQTHGLPDVPGFRPRPSGVDRTADRMDSQLLVGREYRFGAG